MTGYSLLPCACVEKVMRAFDFLAGQTVPHGLYPIRVNPNTGKFTSSQARVSPTAPPLRTTQVVQVSQTLDVENTSREEPQALSHKLYVPAYFRFQILRSVHLRPCPLFVNQVTLGALGDSFYEYLLKVWLQGGRTENNYRRMYDDAMDGVEELLVQKASNVPC